MSIAGDRSKTIRFAILALSALVAVPFAAARADVKHTTFAVMRNGEQIGTNTIEIARTGSQTTVDVSTHIAVTLAFVTVYRFDQTLNEEWSDSRLQSLRTRTDDNGSVHQTSAGRAGEMFAVRADDRDSKAPAAVIPLDLWNPAVLTQTQVLDPSDGTLVPVKIVDHGEDGVPCGGQTVRAHHYTITTNYSQDVWYDKAGELVGVQITGRDGSIIRYQRA
jgi:hypothetical protein